jgi:hypothetical protein
MQRSPLLIASALLVGAACSACSGSAGSGFPPAGADGGSQIDAPTFQKPGGGDAGMSLNQGDTGGGVVSGGDGGGTVVTTIYADTDTALYTLDPATNQVTMIGAFSGFLSGEAATDCAVNAEGDVYINSEATIYKATLPAGGAGSVVLTEIAPIALAKDQSFYALAFAPAGVLGAGETLVGGDNNGELWSIDPTTGATTDLGSFGSNPSKPSDILSLSGDIVFYINAMGQATGLATIRSCDSDGSDCTKTNDYLAGIDMAALEAAYTSGTPATSLLAGVYGGGASDVGSGTGYGELFGLGAWQGTVFGFGHDPADLVTIDASGVGTLLASNDSSGWAGAGVSTKTTITIAAPPPASK